MAAIKTLNSHELRITGKRGNISKNAIVVKILVSTNWLTIVEPLFLSHKYFPFVFFFYFMEQEKV